MPLSYLLFFDPPCNSLAFRSYQIRGKAPYTPNIWQESALSHVFAGSKAGSLWQDNQGTSTLAAGTRGGHDSVFGALSGGNCPSWTRIVLSYLGCPSIKSTALSVWTDHRDQARQCHRIIPFRARVYDMEGVGRLFSHQVAHDLWTLHF